VIPVPLPSGWGEAALFDRDETPWKDATRSYDHGGGCLAWRVPADLQGACDMERSDKDAGTLPHDLGVPRDGFLDAWVAAEASAKLFHVPIVLWLRQRGLAQDPRAITHTLAVAGRTMAFCRSQG
jgi:hypothetical protein